MAAPALGAVRLQQRPHPEVVDAVHKYMEVVRGMRELGTTSSGGMRVRAAVAASFSGFAPKGVTSQSRGKICRVPLCRTSSTPRREALLSAMSEEHDITDMQETDKVSGEWWKPILTAVHDWSQDKLLGLAELADGSLFFSFGPGSDSNSASHAKASRPKSETTKVKNSAPAHNSAPQRTVLPQRHPSSFRKHSPIPASRKKAVDLNEAAVESTPQKMQKAAKSKSAAHPQRLPNSFSKRSPIPKNQVNSISDSVSAPASKKNSHSAVEDTALADAPSFDSTKDSPFSSEVKEILNSGNKETTEQESKESVKSARKSTATPALAKKKASKALSEEPVEVSALTSSASGSPAAKKKASSKPSNEETVEAAPQTSSGPLVAPKKKASKVSSEEETVVEVTAAAAAATAAAENNGAGAASAVSEDLGSYKLPELKSLAKARGLKGYSKLKKGELVDLLAGLES